MASLLTRTNWNKAQGWYSNGLRVAWFDKRTRSWITHLIDSGRHQVGEADYLANREQFLDCEASGYFDPLDDLATLNALLNENEEAA